MNLEPLVDNSLSRDDRLGDKRQTHSLALLRRAVCQYTMVGAEVPVLSGSLEGGRGGKGKERGGGELQVGVCRTL